jgi:dTDP-4-amino-4,6-dideoxygalactose transaminase
LEIPFVDLKAQYASIKREIDEAIADVISKSAFIGGPFVKAFESSFAEFCGAKHCVGVGNGTDAIFLVLKAMGIGHGDEVITAANSFIATSEAISMCGAKVVFVDVRPDTLNIDAGKIEEKIAKKTKAIIPVHLYGQPADMEPILQLGQKYKLKVIEDAAQAHGALYKGKVVGSLGDSACFSFYPGKNLGAYGDAGAIVTNNDDLALKVRKLSNHGRLDKYDHRMEGVNSRLDGLQAAILSAKLPFLPAWTDLRRRNAYLYNKYLRQVEDIVTPVEMEGTMAVYHLYVLRVRMGLRGLLQKDLMSNGISTGIHYPTALPILKAYSHLNHVKEDFPIATTATNEILSLPMFPELQEGQIRYITEKVEECLLKRKALDA